VPLLEVCDCEDERACQELINKQAIALLRIPGKRAFSVRPPKIDLFTRVTFLNAVVDRYKDRARMDRTRIEDVDTLAKLYPRLTALVVLPTFRIEEVLYLAGAGHLLPTGSTRFTISPRALHVNYPLEELRSYKTLEEKDAALQRWIQERIAKKGVRYYAESTFLFDE
jgi:hypothetical protein